MTVHPSKIPNRFFTLPMPEDGTYADFDTFRDALLEWSVENIGDGHYMARVYHDNRVVMFIPEEKYCVFFKLRWSNYIERD